MDVGVETQVEMAETLVRLAQHHYMISRQADLRRHALDEVRECLDIAAQLPVGGKHHRDILVGVTLTVERNPLGINCYVTTVGSGGEITSFLRHVPRTVTSYPGSRGLYALANSALGAAMAGECSPSDLAEARAHLTAKLAESDSRVATASNEILIAMVYRLMVKRPFNRIPEGIMLHAVYGITRGGVMGLAASLLAQVATGTDLLTGAIQMAVSFVITTSLAGGWSWLVHRRTTQPGAWFGNK